MAIPNAATYVVIGAGVHGLSTAYHLGRALREKGRGSGADIVLLEKKRAGAGASGIACGVVRNFYYQPAMKEIMPDFHTEGLEAVLHEKQGGYAERDKAVRGLAQLARNEGVSLLEGVEV